MKRTAIRRKPRPAEDRVRPEDAAYIIARDHGCIAPIVDPDCGPCGGWFAGSVRPTIEHVRIHAAMGAPRARSIRCRMVALCPHHHLDGWASTHKEAERRYLRLKEPCNHPNAEPNDWSAHFGTCPDCGDTEVHSALYPEDFPDCLFCQEVAP